MSYTITSTISSDCELGFFISELSKFENPKIIAYDFNPNRQHPSITFQFDNLEIAEKFALFLHQNLSIPIPPISKI